MSEAPTLVLLVRHAETAFNADGRLRGLLDPPLNENGRRQALILAGYLHTYRPVRIVSSPLTRARQTADAIARRCGCAVTADVRLVDRDYGRWAGHPTKDVVSRFCSLDAAPGVEPAAEVVRRASAVLDEVGSGTTVMVSHDAVNRLLLCALTPTIGAVDTVAQRCACWNVLRRTGLGWQVEAVDQVTLPVAGVSARGWTSPARVN